MISFYCSGRSFYQVAKKKRLNYYEATFNTLSRLCAPKNDDLTAPPISLCVFTRIMLRSFVRKEKHPIYSYTSPRKTEMGKAISPSSYSCHVGSSSRRRHRHQSQPSTIKRLNQPTPPITHPTPHSDLQNANLMHDE